jgi:hypothetical protein
MLGDANPVHAALGDQLLEAVRLLARDH